MKKIKEYIIHMLGGYTQEELNYECYYATKLEITNIKSYLDLINGTNADDWCKMVYNYICRKSEKAHPDNDC